MNLSWFLEQSKLTQVYAGENLNKNMRLTINLSWESKTGFKPGILPTGLKLHSVLPKTSLLWSSLHKIRLEFSEQS